MHNVLVVFSTAILLSLIPGITYAQEWHLLHQFPGYISFVKMQNGRLFVATGVAPDGQHGATTLFRSTNKGQSWTQCTSPLGYNAKLSDLTMIDDNVGFACLWCDGSKSGLWRTTDAGMSWTETGLPGSFTSIVGDSSRLILTDLFGNARMSVDRGVTFSGLSPSGSNHVAFLDKYHGATSNFRGDGFWYTSDGGKKWKCSTQSIECWSICADTSSGAFFAAPEGSSNSGGYHTQVFRSDDFGKTWTVTAQLPFTGTGHIAATNTGQLFVQVLGPASSTYSGLYTSTDHGANWTGIHGPSSLGDTRFCAYSTCSGTVVFAFDDKNPGSLYRYGLASDDLFYFTYFERQATTLDATLTLPLAVRLPIKYGADHRVVRHIDFTVTSSGDALEIQGFNAPKGWRLTGITNQQNTLDVSLDRTGGTLLEDSCTLGALSLHALHVGKATISIQNVFIEDDSSLIGLCSVPEGQAVSIVTVADQMSVSSLTSPLRLHINGLEFGLDGDPSMAMNVRLVDMNGVIRDEQVVQPIETDVRYEIPRSLHGGFFVIVSDPIRSSVFKIVVK